MSVQTEIDRISTAVQNAHLKVIEKGGTSAAPYLVGNLASAIDTIPEATALDGLNNPGSADTMLKGTEMLNAEGKKVTGAIETIKAAQIRPDLSISDGIARASVSLPHGKYIDNSANVTMTKNVTIPAIDKEFTPAQTTQIYNMSDGYYIKSVTVHGDANLVAGNIKSGVSIFGVAGTMTAGEDVTAETETYTDLLTDLEAAVDALPDAGSGGGVETCTVTIVDPNRKVATVLYQKSLGTNEHLMTDPMTPAAGNYTCVAGSMLYISCAGAVTITCENCVKTYISTLFVLPTGTNQTATVTIT